MTLIDTFGGKIMQLGKKRNKTIDSVEGRMTL